jgi:hypothetical protein
MWPVKYRCSYFEVIFFTCHTILQHGTDGFISSLKECVLRIFIALAGFEPMNLGSSGEHSNHYTTKAI